MLLPFPIQRILRLGVGGIGIGFTGTISFVSVAVSFVSVAVFYQLLKQFFYLLKQFLLVCFLFQNLLGGVGRLAREGKAPRTLYMHICI